jgi:hypothetical protein
VFPGDVDAEDVEEGGLAVAEGSKAVMGGVPGIPEEHAAKIARAMEILSAGYENMVNVSEATAALIKEIKKSKGDEQWKEKSREELVDAMIGGLAKAFTLMLTVLDAIDAVQEVDEETKGEEDGEEECDENIVEPMTEAEIAELVVNGTSDMKREIEGYLEKKEEIEQLGDSWADFELEEKMSMVEETMNLFHIAVGQRFLQYAEKKGKGEVAELIARATKELQLDLEGVPDEMKDRVKEAFLEKAKEFYDDNVRPGVIDKIKSGVAKVVIFPALDACGARKVEDSGEGVQC